MSSATMASTTPASRRLMFERGVQRGAEAGDDDFVDLGRLLLRRLAVWAAARDDAKRHGDGQTGDSGDRARAERARAPLCEY